MQPTCILYTTRVMCAFLKNAFSDSNVGKVALQLTQESLARASDAANNMGLRTDAAEAAEAAISAKHKELIDKYGALVGKWQAAATYRKRFFVQH